MKRVSAVLAVSLVCAMCLFAVGCGGGNNPSAVALKFYEAVAKGDAEAMGKYATSETIATFVPLMSKVQPLVAAMGKPRVVSQEIDGDHATVVLKFANEEDPEEVELVKVDGKWRVHSTLDSGSSSGK